MINIAVVDDFEDDADKLISILKEYARGEQISFNFFYFSSGSVFLEDYQSRFDLLFLDIELGDENGIDIARRLREIDRSIPIIFITNVPQYALEGYGVDALDFLVKPVTLQSMELKMPRIISRIHESQVGSIIIKTLDDEMIKLPIARIKYLQVDEHYIIYHTTDGIYKEYQTLKQAEMKIADKHFVRSNRSHLVNLSYVDSIKRDNCIIDGDRIPISRPQKNNFLRAYCDYLEGE